MGPDLTSVLQAVWLECLALHIRCLAMISVNILGATVLAGGVGETS